MKSKDALKTETTYAVKKSFDNKEFVIGESGNTATMAHAANIKFDEMDQTQNGNIEFGAMTMDSKMSKFNAQANGYAATEQHVLTSNEQHFQQMISGGQQMISGGQQMGSGGQQMVSGG